jgi:hypothetical protein
MQNPQYRLEYCFGMGGLLDLAATAGMPYYPLVSIVSHDPGIEWYQAQSGARGVSPRCPFASSHRCPRYYQSLSVLGNAGLMTKMDPKTDRKLERKWKRSDLWPTNPEQATSVSGGEGEPSVFSHFCPEVAFDTFGYFAEFLARYADEIDRDAAHRRLSREGASDRDWRWSFSALGPLHFTECSVYSALGMSGPTKEDIIEVKPNIHGIGLNLNALLRRLFGRGGGRDS